MNHDIRSTHSTVPDKFSHIHCRWHVNEQHFPCPVCVIYFFQNVSGKNNEKKVKQNLHIQSALLVQAEAKNYRELIARELFVRRIDYVFFLPTILTQQKHADGVHSHVLIAVSCTAAKNKTKHMFKPKPNSLGDREGIYIDRLNSPMLHTYNCMVRCQFSSIC